MSEPRQNFWIKYSFYCVQDKFCPSKYLLRHCKGTELCCPVEVIRPEHWKHLLFALSTDNSLTKVHFASCILPHGDDIKPAKCVKTFPTPYGRSEVNISDICVSLAGLLRSSQQLQVLKLENLTFKPIDIEQIAIGLAESCHLKLLSFCGSKFEPGAIKVLCNGLIKSGVSWLDLSICALTESDIEAICDLIKRHAVKRANEMFPDTLRYNFPHFDGFSGLNRISLNNNAINDKGVFALAESLADDNFIKAIDLQNCGITNNAALKMLTLASSNKSIEVIDLRLNIIDDSLLQRISQQLALNKAGKENTHENTSLWTPSAMIMNFNNIGKVKTLKKPVHKYRYVKRTSISRFHHYSPVLHAKSKSPKDACVQTANDNLMEDLRKRYNNEMKLRKFFLNKCKMLKEENLQLRSFLRGETDNIYIDQETYFDIKHTFEKLKIFFDVMKKYGLWEYISMLGFDENTDVIIKESDAHKSLKLTRKESPVFAENVQDSKLGQEPCCNCRKADSKHCHEESPNSLFPETQNCIKTECIASKMAKLEESLNEKIAYKLLQEVMNDYNNVASQQIHSAKPILGKMSNMPQDNAKPCSSKQCGSSVPNASSGAHMLMKKFSYSNMPKRFKELVTPADFYDIVKKELERCESATAKPMTSQGEISSQVPPQPAQIKVRTEISVPNLRKRLSNPAKEFNDVISITSENGRVIREESFCGQIMKQQSSESISEEDFENMPISELMANEYFKQKKNCVKQEETDLDALTVQLEEVSKSIKAPVMPKFHKTILPKSKLKHSSSSQTGYEMSASVLLRRNISSDEINSSDGIVTTSDKVCSSSTSTSSSNKSNVKSVSSHKESQPPKSYLESVSDASTFKDVESILETEVVSQSEDGKGGSELKDSNISVAKTSKSKSNSSSSSTTRKDPKFDKPVKLVESENSLKNASNKSNKSAKSNSALQAKTKSTPKQSNKSRPKSNSSKSSSVPSLSDITTVGSESLNTDSVMKKISLSEDTSKGGN